jgi:hypothetical protein
MLHDPAATETPPHDQAVLPSLVSQPPSSVPITDATIAYLQQLHFEHLDLDQDLDLSGIHHSTTPASRHQAEPITVHDDDDDDDDDDPYGERFFTPGLLASDDQPPATKTSPMMNKFLHIQAVAKANIAGLIAGKTPLRPTPWSRHRTMTTPPVPDANVPLPNIAPEQDARSPQDARTIPILQRSQPSAATSQVRWDPTIPDGMDPDLFSGLSPTFIRSCNIHQRPTVTVPNTSPAGVHMFHQATHTPALNMASAPASAPAWDTHSRTAHKTPIRSQAAALAAHRNLAPRHGYYATHIQVAPDELCVDSYTNTVPPWIAVHPKVGRTIMNYPVVLDVTIMDPELFFTGFKDQFRTDQLKYFLSVFPKYTPHTSFFDYHEAVVRYCMVYGCFVAPIHTLRPGLPLGTWFLHARLPHVIRNSAQTLAPTLAMALTGTHSGLSTDPRFQPFLQGGNGHLILLHIAGAAGHPLLTAQGTIPPDPRQRPDQSLVSYLTMWTRHLKHHLLVGTVYSDRHYIDQVMTGMHPSLCAQFDSEVADRKNMTPYGTPLPDSLQPGFLLVTFHGRAAELGHPEYATMTPRELRDASQPVRMIEETDLAIRALNTTRLCALCSDPGHLLRECPFQNKLNDPAIRKAIGLPALKPSSFKLHQITDEFPDFDPDEPTVSPLETTSPQDF